LTGLFLIPALVAGYIVFSKSPIQQATIHRHQGQLLYLNALFKGVISTILGASLIPILLTDPCDHSCDLNVLLRQLIHDFFSALALEPDVSNEATALVEVTLFAVIAAFCWVAYDYLRIYWLAHKEKLLKTSWSEKRFAWMATRIFVDSPMDNLLSFSCITKKPLLIQMKTGKVYIGTVTYIGPPNEKDSFAEEISIAPAFTGCRDDNNQLLLTTSYKGWRHLEVALNRVDIATLSVYDKKAMQSFNPKIFDKFRYEDYIKKSRLKTTFKALPLGPQFQLLKWYYKAKV